MLSYSNLASTSHTSDLNMDRARLVYGLVTKMDMDVGSFISGQISQMAQSNSSRLGFPAPITALLEKSCLIHLPLSPLGLPLIWLTLERTAGTRMIPQSPFRGPTRLGLEDLTFMLLPLLPPLLQLLHQHHQLLFLHLQHPPAPPLRAQTPWC